MLCYTVKLKEAGTIAGKWAQQQTSRQPQLQYTAGQPAAQQMPTQNTTLHGIYTACVLMLPLPPLQGGLLHLEQSHRRHACQHMRRRVAGWRRTILTILGRK